jgi:hypothetical protein
MSPDRPRPPSVERLLAATRPRADADHDATALTDAARDTQAKTTISVRSAAGDPILGMDLSDQRLQARRLRRNERVVKRLGRVAKKASPSAGVIRADFEPVWKRLGITR